MQRRSRTARLFIVAIAGVLTSLTVLCAPASSEPAGVRAQTVCAPPVDDYPPSIPPGGNVGPNFRLAAGLFIPGNGGRLELSGAVAQASYAGRVSSTPIALPATSAAGDGSLVFNFAVPSDFELRAFHHLDITCPDGRVLASFDFCVDARGFVASASACRGGAGAGGGGDSLARTGLNYLDDLIRLAALLLVVGALLEYQRRRRAARVSAA